MEVHKQISSHSEKQHKIVKDFLFYDDLREREIEKATALAREGQPFSVDNINAAAVKINKIAAAHGITPTRTMITEKMVTAHAAKK